MYRSLITEKGGHGNHQHRTGVEQSTHNVYFRLDRLTFFLEIVFKLCNFLLDFPVLVVFLVIAVVTSS